MCKSCGNLFRNLVMFCYFVWACQHGRYVSRRFLPTEGAKMLPRSRIQEDGTLEMGGSLIINPIHASYSGYLRGISSLFKGLQQWGFQTARGPPSRGYHHFPYETVIGRIQTAIVADEGIYRNAKHVVSSWWWLLLGRRITQHIFVYTEQY